MESSLVVQQVVIATNRDATNDEKVGIMATLCFQRGLTLSAHLFPIQYTFPSLITNTYQDGNVSANTLQYTDPNNRL